MADYDWFRESPEQRRRKQELEKEGFKEVYNEFNKIKCLKCHSLIFVDDKEKHKDWHAKLGA